MATIVDPCQVPTNPSERTEVRRQPLMLSKGNTMLGAAITLTFLQSVAASIYFDESMKTIIS